jgi:group I intron endonuclease
MSKISNKGEVDYTKGKIYVIKNNQNTKLYVGSTTWEVAKRFNEHKRSASKDVSKNYKLYAAMTELGVDCFYWEEIESYPCENVSQLRAREGYWIREYKSWLDDYGYNKKMETRTRHEYYEDTKDHIKEKVKEYYINHKEERDQYKKMHYVENEEHFKQYKQEYYQKHKEARQAKSKELITCECGQIVCHGALAKHKLTQKHIKAVEPSETQSASSP